jgi:DNA-3-methyladenine glycosylase I
MAGKRTSEENAKAVEVRDLPRCNWPGLDDPLYAAYHDTEWGVPQTDSRKLFEKLVLESFQSGLSWLTILKKRNAFREAFDEFDPEKIARYNSTKLGKLITNKEIVRNQAKIAATISNARAYLKLSEDDTFANFVWGFVDHKPQVNTFDRHEDVPAQTEASRALAKALKQRGFRFVGPTTAYAFMQSMGLVNDHLTSCHRHAACAKLQRKKIKIA